MQVIFKPGCLNQTIQDPQFRLFCKALAVTTALHLHLQPLHDLRLGHIAIFHADRLAVGLFKVRNDLAQAGLAKAYLLAGFKECIEIILREIEILDRQCG